MRYVCVHGHFYQPPRENPSLEAIELQDSAYPYHDWNERITAECYAPNGCSRILDSESRIATIQKNYAWMSFNFGPTLLSWLKDKAPDTYRDILAADLSSSGRFSGHGSAMAQCYNHMIMPLANSRDKLTQVVWGIQDFRHRYGRNPEGMWLPETAADLETLDIFAQHGIRFTVLAPSQAKSMDGEDVTGQRIDPTRAYLLKLPSGRAINLFFYDGPISRAVAFEGLLNNGEQFARRLLDAFSDQRDWPQLGNIATDGETYGHHHAHGDMALAYALDYIHSNGLAKITNYGEYLEHNPPTHEVEILESTAWSCVHGVGRWNANCGCNSGGRGDWNQEWRAPLRAAFDWLRDEIAPCYETAAARYLKDPWAARNDYIHVILDRAPDSLERFGTRHFRPKNLQRADRIQVWKLLELQRHAMLMYTSCGWFFDELSGIETVQVIHYAGRAVELAKEFLGGEIESQFLEHLRQAKSNLPEHGDGAAIYEKWVKPAAVDIEKLAGHYAISSLFENYSEKTGIYCYGVDREQYSLEAEGKLRLATGRARFNSEITRESATMSFGVLHLGDHNVTGGVRHSDEPQRYEELKARLIDCFSKADTAAVIRILDEEFSEHSYSLSSLFRDEQRKIVGLLLNDSLTSAAAAYRNIYENQAPLIRFLNSLNIPVPAAFKAAADVAINSQLRQAFERPDLDADNIQSYLKEAATSRVPLDITTLEFTIRRRLEEQATRFAEDPDDMENVQRFRKQLELAQTLPFPVTLWEVQNISYGPLMKAIEERRLGAENSDPEASTWMKELTALRDGLRILGA